MDRLAVEAGPARRLRVPQHIGRRRRAGRQRGLVDDIGSVDDIVEQAALQHVDESAQAPHGRAPAQAAATAGWPPGS